MQTCLTSVVCDEMINVRIDIQGYISSAQHVESGESYPLSPDARSFSCEYGAYHFVMEEDHIHGATGEVDQMRWRCVMRDEEGRDVSLTFYVIDAFQGYELSH